MWFVQCCWIYDYIDVQTLFGGRVPMISCLEHQHGWLVLNGSVDAWQVAKGSWAG